MMPPPMSPAQVVPGHFVRPGPPTSPSTTSQSPKQNSQVTPPHQTRGHFPQYMPVYPYGMFSPYYYSWLWILSECFIFLILWTRFLSRHFVNKIVKSPVLRHWILIMCRYVDMYKHLLYIKELLLCIFYYIIIFLHLIYYIWYRRMNEKLYILHWIVNKIVYCIKYLQKLTTFQYLVSIVHIILGVMIWFTDDLPLHTKIYWYVCEVQKGLHWLKELF